ncbi:MAG: hypothetical protein QOH46_3228 [Solirubrobacteraceae bacterium]|jgi:hypothetical protein|nr:hypothetical protein [Solirubrobacteraceae bacterium]
MQSELQRGTLPCPSRRITVEPVEVPARTPLPEQPPAPAPGPAPRPAEPSRPVPSR